MDAEEGKERTSYKRPRPPSLELRVGPGGSARRGAARFGSRHWTELVPARTRVSNYLYIQYNMPSGTAGTSSGRSKKSAGTGFARSSLGGNFQTRLAGLGTITDPTTSRPGPGPGPGTYVRTYGRTDRRTDGRTHGWVFSLPVGRPRASFLIMVASWIL